MYLRVFGFAEEVIPLVGVVFEVVQLAAQRRIVGDDAVAEEDELVSFCPPHPGRRELGRLAASAVEFAERAAALGRAQQIAAREPGIGFYPGDFHERRHDVGELCHAVVAGIALVGVDDIARKDQRHANTGVIQAVFAVAPVALAHHIAVIGEKQKQRILSAYPILHSKDKGRSPLCHERTL